jgi:hypothetical protein
MPACAGMTGKTSQLNSKIFENINKRGKKDEHTREKTAQRCQFDHPNTIYNEQTA